MPEDTPGSTGRKVPTPLGYALSLLLTGNGWTRTELAAAAGVTPGAISACIWEDGLTLEYLEELASFMGLGPADVSCAVTAARVALPPLPPASPVDPTPEDRSIHRQAAATVAGEVFDLVLDHLQRQARQETLRLALEHGRKHADKLKTYPKADQQVLVRGLPEYQHWSVAFVLCADSEDMTPHNPFRALELAELALLVAGHVQGTSAGFKTRLQAWCHGFVGNARRVIGSSLPAAERSFAEAWRLWQLGEDPAGLLSEAYLLDMEASLRRAQREFDQALKLHKDALLVALPSEVGSILFNKAGTLQQQMKHEEALDALALAAEAVDAERQPRLRFGILLNMASNLVSLGRAASAAPLVGEVQRLARRLCNDVDLNRALWLAANCDAGLGRKEEALSKLNQVRRAFRVKGLPFDYALASLDLAAIYHDSGSTQEMKSLAAEMLIIFEAQHVNREGIAAAILFRQAAEEERVTIDIVQQLKADLSKAQSSEIMR